MIYNKSILRKELTSSYMEDSISSKKRIAYALFLALISFAIHNILVTLDKSVLSDAFPSYMSKSCFSTLLLYVNLSYIFYILYLAVNYHFLTFDEIRNNKWYIPIKFGFSPIKMILTKLYARIITILYIYVLGFFLMIILNSLLKYPFIIEYVVPIFLLGLTDLVFIIIITMTSSLYIKKGIVSGHVMFLWVVLISILKFSLGYYKILNNKSNFSSIAILSQFSEYISILFLVSIVCILTIIARGEVNAEYYNFSISSIDNDILEDVNITTLPTCKFKIENVYKFNPEVKLRILTQSFKVLLFIVISLFILLNAFILIISISSVKKEVTILKTIPYVFQSDTMQPTLMFNDLVFFSKDVSNISNGDIVIYESNNQVNISRIQSVDAAKVVVDIDNYPNKDEEKTYSETIDINQIYGKYIGRSRWLGLIVLFANSTLGRLLLLFIPIILIFYFKPMIAMFRYVMNNELTNSKV